MNKYQVRAIFADERKPYAELVGVYRSQIEAEDARDAYENDDDTPSNYMGCEIVYLTDVLE